MEGVNKSGGIFVKELDRTLPVELIHFDDESDEKLISKIVEELVLTLKIDILLGPYSSSLTVEAVKAAKRFNKTVWNHSGATDEVYRFGADIIISAITTTEHYMEGVIDLLTLIDNQIANVAFCYANDSGFATGVARGAIRRAEELGLNYKEFPFASRTSDFSPILRRLGVYKPDVLITAGRMQDELKLAKELIDIKSNFKAIAMVAAGIDEFKNELGDDCEGFLGPSQWEEGLAKIPDKGPDSTTFKLLYHEKYGAYPNYPAAQAYNIGLIFEHCIEKAGSLSDLALRETAWDISLRTFYGDFRLDPDTMRQIGHRMSITQWIDGERAVVYPPGQRVKAPIYP